MYSFLFRTFVISCNFASYNAVVTPNGNVILQLKEINLLACLLAIQYSKQHNIALQVGKTRKLNLGCSYLLICKSFFYLGTVLCFQSRQAIQLQTSSNFLSYNVLVQF